MAAHVALGPLRCGQLTVDQVFNLIEINLNLKSSRCCVTAKVSAQLSTHRISLWNDGRGQSWRGEWGLDYKIFFLLFAMQGILNLFFRK